MLEASLKVICCPQADEKPARVAPAPSARVLSDGEIRKVRYATLQVPYARQEIPGILHRYTFLRCEKQHAIYQFLSLRSGRHGLSMA